MKTKEWVINAVVASLYIVLTGFLAPFSFGAIQFRVGEILNHLVVFERKYIVGIVAGVFLSNLFFSSFGVYDLLFGVSHSLVSLLFTVLFTKNLENVRVKMGINSAMFAFFSFFIAAMLYFTAGLPFWITYATVALGELGVMLVGIPLMEYLNRRLLFSGKK